MTPDEKERIRARQHFHNLLAVALADNILDKVELDHLFKVSKKFFITREELDEILDKPNEHIIHPPENKEEQANRFYNLIEMMAIDGEVDYSEFRLCMSYGVGLGYEPKNIDNLVKETLRMMDEGKPKETIIEMLVNAE